MATAHKSRVLDMTQGDPFRLVLQFSMPLFCSNLLQQLYNLTCLLYTSDAADEL